MSRNLFAVRGTQTTLNGQPFLVKGLRCSNALLSDASADQLIDHLDVFAGYGINTVSVYWMGNRFGDVKGYREDGSLDPVYAARFARIIEAADARAMVVLVGCLYWGDSKAKWESWTQVEANTAVYNTVAWLLEHDYRNVFVDVDNEGMALRSAGFDNRQLLRAGKAADPSCVIATNFRGDPPPEADLAIHFSNRDPSKPYIETRRLAARPARRQRLLGAVQQPARRLVQLRAHWPVHARDEGEPEGARTRAPRPGRGLYAGLHLAAVPASRPLPVPRRRRQPGGPRHPLVAGVAAASVWLESSSTS